jgi:nicotinamide-nucleotide amidase
MSQAHIEQADDLARLSADVGRALAAAGRMLATAESCTGGWIAKCVTDVAGSSGWLDRGFVTYSNDAKRDMLGVSAETLAAQGAVSEAVAREMALGALANSRADVAVAVSGIAGPGGGSAEKPVGTVCFAWAAAGDVRCRTVRFEGDRDAVRRQSVALALSELLRLLSDAR